MHELLRLEHCFSIFSPLILSTNVTSKNATSLTIFYAEFWEWSHSKEKTKLHNRMQAIFEFWFPDLIIDFSSVPFDNAKRFLTVFFSLQDFGSEIEKFVACDCRKNISLSFETFSSPIG